MTLNPQNAALVDLLVRQVLTTFVQVVLFEGHEDVQGHHAASCIDCTLKSMKVYLARIELRILMKECVEVVYLFPPKRIL